MEAKFIVFVLFVLFSIAKSIAQKVKAANEKQQLQVGAAVPPADRAKVQSEIEAFLSSVRAGQGQPPQPSQQGRQLQQPTVAAPVAAPIRRLNQENTGPSFAESRQLQQQVLDDRQRDLDRRSQIREQNDRMQEQGKQRGTKKQNRKPQDPGKRKQNQNPNQTKANRPQERSSQTSGVSSGGSVSQHVNQHMRSHISDDVRADLGVGLPRSVGGNSAPAEAARGAARAVAGAALIQALRSPDGVRQAIVIAEILARPKALRKSNG